jgi:hypothetical protein
MGELGLLLIVIGVLGGVISTLFDEISLLKKKK